MPSVTTYLSFQTNSALFVLNQIWKVHFYHQMKLWFKYLIRISDTSVGAGYIVGGEYKDMVICHRSLVTQFFSLWFFGVFFNDFKEREGDRETLL